MNWHNVSKHEPCPICHKTDWCNLSNDGAVCICHRVESPHLARSGSGWIHRLIDRPYDGRWAKRSCGVARAQRTTIPSAGVVAAQVSPNFACRESDLRSKSEQDSTIHCSPSPSTFTYNLNFPKIHSSFDPDPILVEGLATTLGVDDLALKSLDVRFNRFDECWSFPMRDADGQIIGLRFRELAGSRKWSARGSHDGLFYDPSTVPSASSPTGAAQPDGAGASRPRELVIVEGPSDTAAAMSLFAENEPSTESSCAVTVDATLAFSDCGVGASQLNDKFQDAPSLATSENAKSAYRFCDLRSKYFVVGRSSCQTGAAHLRALIRRVRPRIVTIVADNDVPGIKGAELLAQQLKCPHRSSTFPPFHSSTFPPVRVLVVPAPYKDLRAWYLSNTLSQRLFTDLTSAQRWR